MAENQPDARITPIVSALRRDLRAAGDEKTLCERCGHPGPDAPGP